MISAYIYNTNRDICDNIPIYLNSKSESFNNTKILIFRPN